jgi:hypothetical protein
MQNELVKPSDRKAIEKLKIVRNFRNVIETHDISLMNRELYQFLTLSCGFIAHYDINGYKATYRGPESFAGVFIRHFDCEHRYFNGIYPCDEGPYRETGYSKAEIKRELNRIVEMHKAQISKWTDKCQRDERHNIYLNLKKEFESQGLKLNCKACGNEYEVRVLKEGEDFSDFRIICCLFCGQQMKF